MFRKNQNGNVQVAAKHINLATKKRFLKSAHFAIAGNFTFKKILIKPWDVL